MRTRLPASRSAAIRTILWSLQYDLDGNGILDLRDRDEWLRLGGLAHLPSGTPYRVGDANLDGAVKYRCP